MCKFYRRGLNIGIENKGHGAMRGVSFNSSNNVHRWKAYSTKDGKEALIHIVKAQRWKPEVRDCFLNALRIVENYHSSAYCFETLFLLIRLFLECFVHEQNLENHTISYVTESLQDNVESYDILSVTICSVFAGIGSVRLALVRKWFQDLLIGLAELHSKTEQHNVIIHGRIRYYLPLSSTLVFGT